MVIACVKMSLEKFRFTTESAGASKKKTKGRQASKETYEKERRVRTFVSKWKIDYPWVKHDEENDKMYCTPCCEEKGEGHFVSKQNGP